MGQLCEFPSDHPIRNLKEQQTVPVEEMENNHVYVYNTTFGMNGCVRRLTFCYRPQSGTELMDIEIRNSGNGQNPTIRNVSVSVDAGMMCAEIPTLNHAYCCVNKTSEFMVQNNMSYALRMPNTGNLLLRHQNNTVPGYWTNLHGENRLESLYKPLFYFSIDTSSGTLHIAMCI